MTDGSPNVPEVRITPAGPLREVLTIPAILALRTHGGLNLRVAKTAVEDMVSRGSATVPLGAYAGLLGEPAARAMASTLVDGLRSAGVALHVDGEPYDAAAGAAWGQRPRRAVLSVRAVLPTVHRVAELHGETRA